MIPRDIVDKKALENSKLHYIMAFSEELHQDAKMDFEAGVKLAEEYIKKFAEWIGVRDYTYLDGGIPSWFDDNNHSLDCTTEELFEDFIKDISN